MCVRVVCVFAFETRLERRFEVVRVDALVRIGSQARLFRVVVIVIAAVHLFVVVDLDDSRRKRVHGDDFLRVMRRCGRNRVVYKILINKKVSKLEIFC